MSLRISVALTCAAVLLVEQSTAAHHSFSGAFDLSHKFSVTGRLTKIDWRNPHIQLFVDVKSEQGQLETWIIESMPPAFFRNRDVGGRVDLENAIGRTVTIAGVRARDGSLSGIAQKITFPDGKTVTVLDLQPQS